MTTEILARLESRVIFEGCVSAIRVLSWQDLARTNRNRLVGLTQPR
jgi:hypothetical protein